MLERSGFGVLTAADGQEGVRLYRERADEITLVLLDMTMPRMDGMETMDEMRRIRPDVKNVICSGHGEQKVSSLFAGERPLGFVQKPFQLQQLIGTLRSTLEA